MQIMWMGSGMTQMMYPSLQHYLSGMGMGMGMGHAPLPSIHGPMQLPRVPPINHSISPVLSNQTPICTSQVLNPINLQNQVQNASIPDSYTHYLGIQPMQTAPQVWVCNLMPFNFVFLSVELPDYILDFLADHKLIYVWFREDRDHAA